MLQLLHLLDTNYLGCLEPFYVRKYLDVPVDDLVPIFLQQKSVFKVSQANIAWIYFSINIR